MKVIEIPPAKPSKFPWRDYLIAVLIFAGLLAAAVVIGIATDLMMGPWW